MAQNREVLWAVAQPGSVLIFIHDDIKAPVRPVVSRPEELHLWPLADSNAKPPPFRFESGHHSNLLAGCASPASQFRQFAAWAPGHDISVIVHLLGNPTSRGDVLADGTRVTEWDAGEPTANASVPLSLGALADVVNVVAGPVGWLAAAATAGNVTTQIPTGGGNCRTSVTVPEASHLVQEVHCSGPNGGMTGPDSVCAASVREAVPALK